MRFGAVLIAMLALAACGGSEETRPLPEGATGTTPAATATETSLTETQPSDGEGDAAAGKDVFASAGCGSCHALADAGSTGTVGPDLDQSAPDRELIVERVTNGSGAMPPFKDQLSEQQIQDVAAYVFQATH